MKANTLIALFILVPILAPAAQTTPLEVATTHPFLAEWVKAVGQEHVTVTELSPAAPKAPEGTALIFETGMATAGWVKVPETAEVVILSDGLPTMRTDTAYWAEMPLPHPNPEKMPPCCKKDAADTNAAWKQLVEQHPAEAQAATGQTDPHLWYAPGHAMTAVLMIGDTLASLDPDHADTYERNTYAYLERLEKLDGWVKSKIRDIPMSQRVLLSDGGHFRYFAKAYGLIAPQGQSDELEGVFIEAVSPAALPCQCQIDGSECTCPPGSCQCATLFLFTHEAPPEAGMGNYEALTRANTRTLLKATQGD